ncbi:MAG: DUF6056 family protein [Alphaproteobacteria bacterium]
MKKNKIATSIGKHWGIIFFLLVFTYMALLSYLMPLMWDDIAYTRQGKLIANIDCYTALDCSKWLYLNVGWRFVYLFIPFLYQSLYRAPFEEELSGIIHAIINGGIFLLFLWGLFMLLYARKPKLSHRHDLIRIILLFFFSLTLSASIFETIFWFHGRINYLWTTTLLLWFLVFYRLRWADKNFLSFMEKPTTKTGKIFIKQIAFWCFFLPLAAMAGMASDIGNMVVIILLASVFIYKKFIVHEKIPKWMGFVFLFFLLGYSILMLAPGNVVRFEFESITQAYQTLPFLTKYIIHPLKGTLIFIIETKFMPIIAMVVLGYWYKTIPIRGKNLADGLIKKIKHNQSFGFALLLFMLTLLFIAGMGLNPMHYARAWHVGTIIFLLCFMVMIDYFFLSPQRLFFLKKTYFGKTISQYLFLLVSGGFIIYAVWVFTFMVDFRRIADQRIASILLQKQMGKDIIVIKPWHEKYIFYRFQSRKNGYKHFGTTNQQTIIKQEDGILRWLLKYHYSVTDIIIQDN